MHPVRHTENPPEYAHASFSQAQFFRSFPNVLPQSLTPHYFWPFVISYRRQFVSDYIALDNDSSTKHQQVMAVFTSASDNRQHLRYIPKT
jgi:hypothetical protein